MKRLLTLLLFFSSPVIAQKVYLPHEVETQAEPAGGLPALNQFINSNLQIPFPVSVGGVNTKVFLKATVQPDGTVGQIEVTRGSDTLCNAEAIRVFKLYQAWKPATIGGQKVPQTMSFPITFRAEPKTTFDAGRLAFVDYFNDAFGEVDSASAHYRRTTPVDERGFVNGEVAYEEVKGKKWKKIGAAKFSRTEIRYKSSYINPKSDSIVAYRISARDYNEASHATEAVFDANGHLLTVSEYSLDGKLSAIRDYDLKGMVRRQQNFSDSLHTELYWDPNGQIRSHRETPVGRNNERGQPLLVNSWGYDGTQHVKNGEGYWMAVSETQAGEPLFEQGRVVNGLKDGKWTGKLADSTQFYEEVYDVGQMKSGVSWINGEKIEYSSAMISPAFKGGIREFYKFLASNIRYPIDAARRGVAGRVMLSFVVCEDGSMCDYKVENRIGYGLDDEALRVVKLMNGKWEPGSMRGQKVKVKYNVPINFQLQNSRTIIYR